MTQVIYQVEIVGWKEKYYFGKEGVAKEFGEKYIANGYKEYKIKAISVREEI
jgi:hypothetical protein